MTNATLIDLQVTPVVANLVALIAADTTKLRDLLDNQSGSYSLTNADTATLTNIEYLLTLLDANMTNASNNTAENKGAYAFATSIVTAIKNYVEAMKPIVVTPPSTSTPTEFANTSIGRSISKFPTNQAWEWVTVANTFDGLKPNASGNASMKYNAYTRELTLNSASQLYAGKLSGNMTQEVVATVNTDTLIFVYGDSDNNAVLSFNDFQSFMQPVTAKQLSVTHVTAVLNHIPYTNPVKYTVVALFMYTTGGNDDTSPYSPKITNDNGIPALKTFLQTVERPVGNQPNYTGTSGNTFVISKDIDRTLTFTDAGGTSYIAVTIKDILASNDSANEIRAAIRANNTNVERGTRVVVNSTVSPNTNVLGSSEPLYVVEKAEFDFTLTKNNLDMLRNSSDLLTGTYPNSQYRAVNYPYNIGMTKVSGADTLTFTRDLVTVIVPTAEATSTLPAGVRYVAYTKNSSGNYIRTPQGNNSDYLGSWAYGRKPASDLYNEIMNYVSTGGSGRNYYVIYDPSEKAYVVVRIDN